MVENHDLYVQSNTLLSADAYEHFRNICLEIYKLDLTCFLTSPGLSWQATLSSTKVKLYLLTDMDMLLVVELCHDYWLCHVIHRYAIANNK